jgi:hypothetical protein
MLNLLSMVAAECHDAATLRVSRDTLAMLCLIVFRVEFWARQSNCRNEMQSKRKSD